MSLERSKLENLAGGMIIVKKDRREWRLVAISARLNWASN